ncbi:MAG: tetratricopeptide repeat protein [Myxococcota bacterium]
MQIRRYLLGALAVPSAGVALVVAALAGPWSPLALDRADARYIAGDVAGARAAYQAAAEGWHFPSTRAEAARRAGLLALREGDATAAVEWLRRSVELQPATEARGELRTQLATVYLELFADPVRAAEQFEAARVERGSAEPALEAARAWERAGLNDRAYEAYAEALRGLPEGPGREEARTGLERVAKALDGAADAG